MKRFIKVFVNLLAVMLLSCTCFGLVGCEDYKTMKVTVSIYNYTDKVFEDKVITVDLYRHVAPKTVDAIMQYAKDGYYNDAMFYLSMDATSQVMVGDLKFDNTTLKISQNLDATNHLKETVKGEFYSNGVTGSNLSSQAGTIGLWRNFTSAGFDKSDDARNSGRATWFIPTTDKSDYDDYFCVFGKFDLSNDDIQATWNSIVATLFTETCFEEYVIYYTGEYIEGNSENNGLTFHCVTQNEYNALSEQEKEDVFVAEAGQYTQYNKHNIRVPLTTLDKTTRQCALTIKSISF